MRVYPPQLQVSETEGFTDSNDLFRRKALGDGLTNIVANVEDPLVIALDGVWGSGKSTFLRMWASELRKAGYPVIVFDAFENDYVDDAFAALARELIELSEASISASEAAADNIKERAVELGGMLLRGAGRIAVNVGVRAATAGLASVKDFEGIAEQIENEVAGVADKYMEDLLSQPAKQKTTVTAFREALSKLPTSLANRKIDDPKPLIYIIDELDRCKPIFALSVLERIKHFLAVPNVHFVLGVHLRQLEASVRAIYGNEIDAGAYLQKFITLTIQNVDTPDRPESGSLRRYADYLIKKLPIPEDSDSPLKAASGAIVRAIEMEGASFRTLERAFTVLAISLAFTPSNQLRLGPLIGGLIVLKVLHPTLFAKAKTKRLTLPEVVTALHLKPLGQNQDRSAEWQMEWWTYCLANELPQKLEKLGEQLFRYSINDDRADLVPYTANDIVDRLK